MSVGKTRAIVIPMLPEEESLRIIEKINVLMSLCDTLQQQLQQAQTTQQQLVSALVEQAITTHYQHNEANKVV